MKLRSGLVGHRQDGVVVKRRAKVGDGHGGEIEDYVVYIERWRARIFAASGQMQRVDLGIVWYPTHKVQGVPVDLRVDDRIVDKAGNTYEVRFVYPPGGYHQRQDAMTADLVMMNQAVA